MRFLADSCVAGSVVRALRERGYDVDWVIEWTRDPGDREILDRAFAGGRVIVTRDKDFGELIFRDNRPHNGLLRLAGEMTFAEQARRVVQVLEKHAADLERSGVVTVESDRMRVSKSAAQP